MDEKLRHVNAVLQKLSQDEDLHDDLKLPAVKAAIDHWTNRNRLDPEKAQMLQNNRRVVYVLQQFQMLQNVCNRAEMPVPLDHLLLRKSELEPSIINGYFQDKASVAVKSNESIVPKETKELRAGDPQKIVSHEVNVAPSEPVNKKEKSEQPTAKSTTRIGETGNITASSGVHVNDIIKFFIAVTFVLIAVVLAQLFR